MEWLKIDINRLPEREVLAANFKPKTYGYKEKLIGYFGKKGENIYCENEGEILENCTHYIPINNFDII